MTDKIIESPIFGDCKIPDQEVVQIITLLIERYPLTSFQRLNRLFNSWGYALCIDVKEASNV